MLAAGGRESDLLSINGDDFRSGAGQTRIGQGFVEGARGDNFQDVFQVILSMYASINSTRNNNIMSTDNKIYNFSY